MKKKLLSILLALVMLLTMLPAFGTVALADGSSTSTLIFTAQCHGSGTADDNVAWTVTSDAEETNFDSTKGIHYGSNNKAVQYIRLSTSGITGTITKVVVNACGNMFSDPNTVGVTVGGTAFGGDPKIIDTTAADYTFTGSGSGEIIVTVSRANAARKALYVKSVAVTYSTSTTVDVTGVTLDKTEAQTIDVGGKVTFTATVAPDNATDKTVKWSVGGTDAGAVTLYTDADCTPGKEVGTNATETLTVYAKGESVGSANVTVTTNDGNKTATCTVTVNGGEQTPSGYLKTTNADIAESLLWNVYFHIDGFDTLVNPKITVGCAADSKIDGQSYTLTYDAERDAYGITVPIRHRLIGQNVSFTLSDDNGSYKLGLGADGELNDAVAYSFDQYLDIVKTVTGYESIVNALRDYSATLLAKWPVEG